MQRALVYKGGALGDFLVTLPLLRGLKSAGYCVDLIGNAKAAALAQANQDLRSVWRGDDIRWMPLFADAPLPTDLCTFFEGYSLLVSFIPDVDGRLKTHWQRLAGPKVLAYPPLPESAPAARHYARPLVDLGLPGPDDWQGRLECFAGTKRSGVILHPGSGSPRKNAPARIWLEVVRRLQGPVTVVGGEADEEVLKPFRGHFEVKDQLSLHDLAQTLGQATLFLGHDTGVAHLAAAVDTPCRLLFGPTDPEVWAPPCALTCVKKTPSLSTLGSEEIVAWLRQTEPRLTWR